jgi:hypothetical protein
MAQPQAVQCSDGRGNDVACCQCQLRFLAMPQCGDCSDGSWPRRLRLLPSPGVLHCWRRRLTFAHRGSGRYNRSRTEAPRIPAVPGIGPDCIGRGAYSRRNPQCLAESAGRFVSLAWQSRLWRLPVMSRGTNGQRISPGRRLFPAHRKGTPRYQFPATNRWSPRTPNPLSYRCHGGLACWADWSMCMWSCISAARRRNPVLPSRQTIALPGCAWFRQRQGHAVHRLHRTRRRSRRATGYCQGARMAVWSTTCRCGTRLPTMRPRRQTPMHRTPIPAIPYNCVPASRPKWPWTFAAVWEACWPGASLPWIASRSTTASSYVVFVWPPTSRKAPSRHPTPQTRTSQHRWSPLHQTRTGTRILARGILANSSHRTPYPCVLPVAKALWPKVSWQRAAMRDTPLRLDCPERPRRRRKRRAPLLLLPLRRPMRGRSTTGCTGPAVLASNR